MPRRCTAPPPTDKEIMSHDNVPYVLAAKYIGWSDVSVRYALQQGRAPFGCAAQNPDTGTWSYNISPGLLVKYKSGELQAWRLGDVIKLAADGVQQIIDAQLDAAATAISGMRRGKAP